MYIGKDIAVVASYRYVATYENIKFHNSCTWCVGMEHIISTQIYMGASIRPHTFLAVDITGTTKNINS